LTDYVLAIDQGTTNSKALLIAADGSIAAQDSASVPVRYPAAGWVEQSGLEIWDSVLRAVNGCLARASSPAIVTIGISNQRESVLLWNRTSGEPIGPCITWQCRRSASRIDAIRTAENASFVALHTGLALDPLFPAAKIAWLLDNYPEARALACAGELCAGTVDTWLIFRLTGGRVHATDAGNASRTQLFDLRQQQWSDDLCGLFDVPKSILPQVRDSDAGFGVSKSASGVPDNVPIGAVMGDSHAALFGHGIRLPGAVKATYGTGSSLMSLTPTPVRSRAGLATTIAWRRGGQPAYALEGNISVSAQAAAWVVELLGLRDVDALTALAATVNDSMGVVIVPAFVGLGAPYWNDRARATISGLSLSTNRAHIARATLESIALQIVDVFAAMETDTGHPLAALSVDGGASRNELLMQIQADMLVRPLHRPKVTELSAFGAGVLAGIARGFWEEADADRLFMERRSSFSPRLSDERRASKIQTWRSAVRSVLSDADCSCGAGAAGDSPT